MRSHVHAHAFARSRAGLALWVMRVERDQLRARTPEGERVHVGRVKAQRARVDADDAGRPAGTGFAPGEGGGAECLP
eukprot:7383409-Prymnesium_polylepis.1